MRESQNVPKCTFLYLSPANKNLLPKKGGRVVFGTIWDIFLTHFVINFSIKFYVVTTEACGA